jgi:hypothetical protein
MYKNFVALAAGGLGISFIVLVVSLFYNGALRILIMISLPVKGTPIKLFPPLLVIIFFLILMRIGMKKKNPPY